MPGIKDGPRNLKQMGAGRGAGVSSGGGRSSSSIAKRTPALKAQKTKTSRPKTLYHGTGSELAPGRKLLPSSSATKYYEFANRFAKMSGPESRVYKVKVPKDAKKVPKWDAPRQDEWQSQKGFTVIKEARVPRRPTSSTPRMRVTTKPKVSKSTSSRQSKGPGRG